MEFDFQRIAERKIEEAISEGKFDNLPGKGKPIVFDDDPMTPPHLRLANKVLKNAGVLPDWMQLEKEIERERAENTQTFAKLEKEYPKRRARALAPPSQTNRDPEKARHDFAAWLGRARLSYENGLKRVNTDILKLNMMTPSIPRAHIPYKTQEEMGRFDTAFPALPGVEVDAAALEAQKAGQEEVDERKLRIVAQLSYDDDRRNRRGF